MAKDARQAYNQTKIRMLSLLSSREELDSKEIARRLRCGHGFVASLRSVEMALLRYYRQGLVVRTGVRGGYRYRLSEKGAGRLKWLLGTAVTESH